VACLSAWCSYESFRRALMFIIIWDMASIPMTLFLGNNRLRIHVAQYADRVKEVTMVIFGEAIFSVTLKHRVDAEGGLDYYVALFLTLWLIYSLALHDHHITPSPDDHALRRSVPASLAWIYTVYFKQMMLLGTSIGIKRLHFLIWSNHHSVDLDTQNLLLWGLSLTLLSIVAIRSYSFGWGRHPSPHDPPKLAAIKRFWWASMFLLSLIPLLVNLMDSVFTPLDAIPFLSTLGVIMVAIIIVEAVLSNIVGNWSKNLNVNERCKLYVHTNSNNGRQGEGYRSIQM